MKKLILVLTFFNLVQICNAQNQKKVINGNFVFEQQVFQYQYKREGNIHSIKLSTLSQPDPSSDLDVEKIEKTKKFIEGLDSNKNNFLKSKPNETFNLIKSSADYLAQVMNIKNSSSIWKEHKMKIDSLLILFNDLPIDSLRKSGGLKDSTYDITELLLVYKHFLENISDPQSSKEVVFSELKQEVFNKIFRNSLAQLYLKKDGNSFETLKDKADTKATEIMYEIKARADFKDDEPVTAYISLSRKYIVIDCKIPVRIKDTSTSNDISKFKQTRGVIPVRFEIKNVIVEFEDGGIKNIFADLLPDVKEYNRVYGERTIRFRNIKPISITGKFDPDVFNQHCIKAGNMLELINTLYEEAKKKAVGFNVHPGDFKKVDMSKSYSACFILSNVLDYRVVSETDNEDYSPANSKIELSEPNSLVELKKEKRSRILSARAYTDFMGLSDNQPNGLVQIEVSKRINIVPGRYQGLFLGIGDGNNKGIYTGGLTFIEPKFTISKIEENNRYLMLDSNQLDKSKSFGDSTNHFLLNPLEVLRFQQWGFGIDINLFKLNLHNRKSNFQINGNFAFGRTTSADSLKIVQSSIKQIESQNLSRISTTTWGLTIMYEVKPDSRYGFSLGFDFRWMDVVNPRFQYDGTFNRRIYSGWFNGFFKVNEDSKVFWRFRKNWLNKNFRYNFYQIQLGYQLDIFKSSK